MLISRRKKLKNTVFVYDICVMAGCINNRSKSFNRKIKQKPPKLNASRAALVEKTAALLAERQDTLAKSKAHQEKVERRRERLIASKEKPAKQPRARKNVAAEDPQMMELKALLASKNMTMEEMLATLRK